MIIISIFKLNLGIDFSSGTRADIQSKNAITQAQVEKTVKSVGLEPDRIQINGSGNKNATVQFKKIYHVRKTIN